MARHIEDYSDKDITNSIANYRKNKRTDGAVYSLAQFLVEQARRSPTLRSPRDIFHFIVSSASSTSSGTITYKDLWAFLKPEIPWKGNHSVTTLSNSLRATIAYCIQNGLPLVTTLVVQSGSGKLSEKAIGEIYEEARTFGREVGIDPQAFISSEIDRAHRFNLDALPQA